MRKRTTHVRVTPLCFPVYIGGGKATIFATLLALFATAPCAVAQSASTVSEISDADQNWTGISPSDAAKNSSDDYKTVYFYNVGKKKFLGRGGRWGTEAVLSEVGQPFTISSYSSGYLFQSSTTELSTATTDKGYLYTPGKKAAFDHYNFFSDATSGTIFYFDAVSNSDSKNIYKITCYRASREETQTTGKTGTKYYMVGAYNSSSTSISSLSSTAIDCFASLSSITDNSDEWILVPKKERHQKFRDNANFRFCHVPGTALLYDDDFARNDQAISYWKQADGTTSLTQAWTADIPESSTTTTYYVGNGIDNNDNQADNGAYMAANMIGANGTIQQTIENVFLPGWYEIRCKATTTSTKGKVVLFAQTGEGTEDGKTSSEYDEAHVKTINTRPATYLEAAKNVASDDYQISVCIKVSKKTVQDESDVECNPITFGVKIVGGEDTDLTTIDNFELVFRGTIVDKIVLDETNEGATNYKEKDITISGATLKTNVNYMEAQNNKRTQLNMCEVYIKRTLKKDMWNSIILPFRLTNADVKAYWGEDAMVSEFVGANDPNKPHIVNFELTEDGIYPNKLYLIKPTELNTTELTEAVESTNATDAEGNAISLTAGTENVYKIDAPRYGVDYNENAVEYTSNLILGDTGKEIQEDDQESLQFAGTFFYKKGCIGAGGYYIANNKWYYLTGENTANSKGFRAWLKSYTPNSSAKGYHFSIDGVDSSDETTAIEAMLTEDNSLPTTFDVYNVSGQMVRKAASSLDGLNKGIYIVQGKKFIVK